MLLVDGYNWLFSDGEPPGTGAETLERMRNRALRLLHGWADWHDDRVLVVFDGYGDTQRQRQGRVEVWFTAGERTADDDMIAWLRDQAVTADVQVVTADRELAARARAEGAQLLSPKEFSAMLAEMRRGATRRLGPEVRPEKPAFEHDVDGMVGEFDAAPPLDEPPGAGPAGA